MATTPGFAPVFMEDTAAAAAAATSTPAFNTTQTTTPAAGSSPAVSEIIDLNDPSLQQEFAANTDVDPYAQPAPMPDGFYDVKLKQIMVKDANQNQVLFAAKRDKNGNAFIFTAIEATIIDPSGRYEGQKIWDRFMSTMEQRNGGIPMVRLLTCLGVKLPANVSAKVLMTQLEAALKSEPVVAVETAWEGGLDEADRATHEQAGVKQPRLFGMHRFPQNPAKPGEHLATAEVQSTLGKFGVRAQARIVGYFPRGTKSK